MRFCNDNLLNNFIMIKYVAKLQQVYAAIKKGVLRECAKYNKLGLFVVKRRIDG